jgi:O-acetyl-ADP-ribose deacetylase (regulator of RNase III)
MTIIYKSGDIFAEPAEAIVNTVNCVGVMGKGIALEFKKRWPENYKAYKKKCDQKLLMTGKVFVFENSDFFGKDDHRFLINFPTKKHWRSKSELSYVEDGLDDLITQIKKMGIKSVAIPPLGCGNGGLDWEDVKILIEAKLQELKDVEVIVFPPASGSSAKEFENIPSGMTFPRAMMLKSLGDFEDYFGGHFTRLSLQKLTYFLQAFGVDFGLKFEKGDFGPYCSKLDTALKTMEKQKYISGYTSVHREVKVTPSAYAAANEFTMVHDCDRAETTLEKLSHLIEGYESPFGMELLSSVHFVYDTKGYTAEDKILAEFKDWNTHKHNSFGASEVGSAVMRLKADKLMGE